MTADDQHQEKAARRVTSLCPAEREAVLAELSADLARARARHEAQFPTKSASLLEHNSAADARLVAYAAELLERESCDSGAKAPRNACSTPDTIIPGTTSHNDCAISSKQECSIFRQRAYLKHAIGYDLRKHDVDGSGSTSTPKICQPNKSSYLSGDKWEECTKAVEDSGCSSPGACSNACTPVAECEWVDDAGVPGTDPKVEHPYRYTDCIDYLKEQEHKGRLGYVHNPAWCATAVLKNQRPDVVDSTTDPSNIQCGDDICLDWYMDYLADCAYRMIRDGKNQGHCQESNAADAIDFKLHRRRNTTSSRTPSETRVTSLCPAERKAVLAELSADLARARARHEERFPTKSASLLEQNSATDARLVAYAGELLERESCQPDADGKGPKNNCDWPDTIIPGTTSHNDCFKSSKKECSIFRQRAYLKHAIGYDQREYDYGSGSPPKVCQPTYGILGHLDGDKWEECTKAVEDSGCESDGACSSACTPVAQCEWVVDAGVPGSETGDYPKVEHPYWNTDCIDYLKEQEHKERLGYVHNPAWCATAVLKDQRPDVVDSTTDPGNPQCGTEVCYDWYMDYHADCAYRMIRDGKNGGNCVDTATCKTVCETGNLGNGDGDADVGARTTGGESVVDESDDAVEEGGAGVFERLKKVPMIAGGGVVLALAEALKTGLKEAPKKAPKEAPKEALKKAPKEAPREALKEALKEALRMALKEAQKKALKEAPAGVRERPRERPRTGEA
eukprot:g10214.t1